MRPRWFGLASVALAICVAAASTRAGAKQETASAFVVQARPLAPVQAPADVYFGTYRLSNLSVRTAIRDMTIEGNSPLALPGQIDRINAVQSALTDWALRYPNDPWLPGTMVRFAAFLRGKQIARYDLVALSLLEQLAAMYPRTWYARYAREKLADFWLAPEVYGGDHEPTQSVPLIFETMHAGIGANRRHHFLF